MADVYLEEVEAIITAGATSAGGSSSFPIFLGHIPDSTTSGVTDRLVGVLLAPGSGDYGRVEVEEPGLQVLVRGAPITEVSTSYEETSAVAFDVKNALHGYAGKPVAAGKNFIGVWNQSGPLFLGHDPLMRPLFSINFRVLRSRTT